MRSESRDETAAWSSIRLRYGNDPSAGIFFRGPHSGSETVAVNTAKGASAKGQVANVPIPSRVRHSDFA